MRVNPRPMPRHLRLPPMGCVSGMKELAARKRQVPGCIASLQPGGHHRPRGIGAPTPVVSRSCGTWESRRDPAALLAGGPTVREAEPSAEQDGQEANAGGRKASGKPDIGGQPLRRRSRITGRIRAVVLTRKGADVAR
jgi:hypothetical protein